MDGSLGLRLRRGTRRGFEVDLFSVVGSSELVVVCFDVELSRMQHQTGFAMFSLHGTRAEIWIGAR